MHRRLRMCVVKCEPIPGFMYDARGDFPRRDFFKNGHGLAGSHERKLDLGTGKGAARLLAGEAHYLVTQRLAIVSGIDGVLHK